MQFLYEKLLELGLNSSGVVSVGTGKTVTKLIQYASEDSEFKKKRFLATSLDTQNLLMSLGLTVLSPGYAYADFAFDGADAIDLKNKQILKGLGGAFLLEKILLSKSSVKVIVAQKEKFVESFSNLPVPFEVVPEQLDFLVSLQLPYVSKKIPRVCSSGKFGLVITEKGNTIVDVYFSDFKLEIVRKILDIPGVLETGLFFDFKCQVTKFDEASEMIECYNFD